MTASRMATRFNTRARPRLTAEHAETVWLHNRDDGSTSSLSVRWRRVRPRTTESVGLGLQAYSGQCTAVVLIADRPATIGPRSTLTRNGEVWEIIYIEPLDEWAEIFHLARPETDQRMPGRFRA